MSTPYDEINAAHAELRNDLFIKEVREAITRLRATERTFRMLLKALLEASEGRNVCVSAYSITYAQDLMYRCHQMADGSAVKVSGRNELTVGVGRILFVSHRTLHRPASQRWIRLHDFYVLNDYYRGI